MRPSRTLLNGLLLASAAAALVPAPRPAVAGEGSRASFLGRKAPRFSLPDAQGRTHALDDFLKGRGAVVIWVSTQCPVSNAYNARMAGLANDYQARGFNFVGINSNRAEAPEEIAAHAQANGFPFPVLKDAGNVVADEYGASVTPEVYVLDAEGILRYHGRIDDSQKESAVTSQDLKAAMDAILAGQAIAKAESKAFGCTIKRVGKAGA